MKLCEVTKNFERETMNAHNNLEDWCAIVKRYYKEYGEDVLYYATAYGEWAEDGVVQPCCGEYFDGNTVAIILSEYDVDDDIIYMTVVCNIVFDMEDYIAKRITTNPKRVSKLKTLDAEEFNKKIHAYAVSEMRELKRSGNLINLTEIIELVREKI